MISPEQVSPVLFDSRDPLYRDPVGAVTAGTAVQLTFLIHRGVCPRRIIVFFGEDGHPAEEHECAFAGNLRQYQKWSVTVRPKTAGLYWYTFRVETAEKITVYGKDQKNRPAADQPDPAAWQMTVYETDDAPAGWAGGVMYQIFPDRFYCSGKTPWPEEKSYATRRTPGQLPTWKREANGDLDTTDFFGGDLKGITEKLDELSALGVTVLYLNPIFEAHSNHRYDTGDYTRIDPLLGDEDDFRALCDAAHARGMKILLDGVFNHTGDDSVYFNKYGRYPGVGAYQSENSPYSDWYSFEKFPDSYAAWWGIPLLPQVNKSAKSYREFITGKDGVVRRWLRAGADGWRLDVADELPDEFLDEIARAVKEEKPDALLLGEVWEDATNKIAYSVRRRYFQGKQLDGVMNYVWKNAVLDFFLQQNSAGLKEAVDGLCEHYPAHSLAHTMNFLGTHDTPRALTVLSGIPLPQTPEEQAAMKLTKQQYNKSVKRLKAAFALLFCLPGIPSVYYGDEAGMEGGNDPLNRRYYPRDNEDADLKDYVARLGKLRKEHPCLAGVGTKTVADGGLFVLKRTDGNDTLHIAVNAADTPCSLPFNTPVTDLLSGKKLTVLDGCTAAVFAE